MVSLRLEIERRFLTQADVRIWEREINSLFFLITMRKLWNQVNSYGMFEIGLCLIVSQGF